MTHAALTQSVIASIVNSGVTAILTSSVGSTAGEDCTAAGYADYLGIAATSNGSNDQRKNGVNRIANPVSVGSATRAQPATPIDVTYTGTDGNPTASWSIGSSGLWTITALGTDKVSVTIPLPDTNTHTIKVACGFWNNIAGGATGTARGSLSGGGAGPTADVITSPGSQIYKQITYTVRANTGGQNFVFTLEGTTSPSAVADDWLLLNRITYL